MSEMDSDENSMDILGLEDIGSSSEESPKDASEKCVDSDIGHISSAFKGESLEENRTAEYLKKGKSPGPTWEQQLDDFLKDLSSQVQAIKITPRFSLKHLIRTRRQKILEQEGLSDLDTVSTSLSPPSLQRFDPALAAEFLSEGPLLANCLSFLHLREIVKCRKVSCLFNHVVTQVMMHGVLDLQHQRMFWYSSPTKSTESLEAFIQSFRTFHHVRNLNLSCPLISSSLLSKFCGLLSLDITNHSLIERNPGPIDTSLSALAHMSNLTKLCITNAATDMEHSPNFITSILPKLTTLKSLSLSVLLYGSCTSEDAVVSALSNISNLQTLLVSPPVLGDKTIQAFAKHGHSIRDFRAPYSKREFSPQVAETLASDKPFELTIFEFSRLRMDGGSHLMGFHRILCQSPNLTSIDCTISHQESLELFSETTHFPNLTHVHLMCVGDDWPVGMSHFLKSLGRTCPTLSDLTLHHNLKLTTAGLLDSLPYFGQTLTSLSLIDEFETARFDFDEFIQFCCGMENLTSFRFPGPASIEGPIGEWMAVARRMFLAPQFKKLKNLTMACRNFNNPMVFSFLIAFSQCDLTFCMEVPHSAEREQRLFDGAILGLFSKIPYSPKFKLKADCRGFTNLEPTTDFQHPQLSADFGSLPFFDTLTLTMKYPNWNYGRTYFSRYDVFQRANISLTTLLDPHNQKVLNELADACSSKNPDTKPIWFMALCSAIEKHPILIPLFKQIMGTSERRNYDLMVGKIGELCAELQKGFMEGDVDYEQEFENFQRNVVNFRRFKEQK